jgi:hypothetical protein
VRREYIAITKTYALAAANAFTRLPLERTTPETPNAPKQPFRFIYVSGAGTTFKPGPFTPFFGRIKGETELQLASITDASAGRFLAHSFRAALPDSSDHDAIKGYIPRLGLMMRASGAVVLPIARNAMKGSWSPTGPMGEFLVQLAAGREEWDGVKLANLPTAQTVGKGGFVVMENQAMRAAMGLDKK